jgi:hypothetical protein
MEELTKNSSPFNSCNISKLKKTRNKLNKTYISVIHRHSKPVSRGVRGKSAKEGSEKDDLYAGCRSSSNSSFPCTLNHDCRPESSVVSAWYKNRSVSCLPTDDVEIPKEFSATNDTRENVTGNDKDPSGSCNQSTNYPKVEDIEIFQEEHLKIQSSFKKRQRTCRHSRQHSKKHQAHISSSNGTGCSFMEPGDKLNFRVDAVQSDTTNTTKEPAHCTVPRSSTLPSLRTATTGSDTHTVGLPVPSLKHTPVFETCCDTPNHSNVAEEGYEVGIMTRFSSSETHRKYLNFDILVCNNISKSESNVRNGTARLREPNQNLNDVTGAARSKLYDPSNYGVKNTLTNGATSALGKESELPSQEGEDGALHLSLPELPLVEKKLPDEKFGHHIQSDREEEGRSPMQSHPPLSPKDNNTDLQNLSLISVQGCNSQKSNPSSGEKSVIGSLEGFRECVANAGICNFSDSTPFCDSRPKSCSDLTLSPRISARQNCESFASTAYSSSPRLTACDQAV